MRWVLYYLFLFLEPVRALHVLRYTFCSHLAMKGAPERAIRELAGHKEIAATQRYMRLSSDAVESAIRSTLCKAMTSKRQRCQAPPLFVCLIAIDITVSTPIIV
ncbi:MAG: tyrosine-type recombinase/integrase [Deltaproteobacteria bacterium]|nr:tyrosine-type recombinase/integrase [Deltaproteobacteria bacterium]